MWPIVLVTYQTAEIVVNGFRATGYLAFELKIPNTNKTCNFASDQTDSVETAKDSINSQGSHNALQPNSYL